MDATLTPCRRGDALDAERFAEMVDSEPFRLLQARIQAELARFQKTCFVSDVELEIRRAQGSVATLQMVLALPEMLQAEMKAAPRYTKQHPVGHKASNA